MLEVVAHEHPDDDHDNYDVMIANHTNVLMSLPLPSTALGIT